MSWTKDALKRLDGWLNLISGLGDATLDRVVNHTFEPAPCIPPQLAEWLYYGDDLAATIADALPSDALRQGIDVPVEDDPDATEDALEELRRLGAQEVFKKGGTWGRVFGGAAAIVVTDDGAEMSEPLDLAKVEEVRFLDFADRLDLVVEKRYGDGAPTRDGRAALPNDEAGRRAQERYGQPEVYRWTQPNGRHTSVHETRMILFPGEETTPRERRRTQDWDRSIYDRTWPVLQQVNHTWQSVVANVDVSAQAVMKIRNLLTGVETGNKETVKTRLELTQQARAMRILPIDAEGESFEYAERSLAGMNDVAQTNWQRLAAAARMPVTRLMGMSPAGLNATGASDVRMWYDQVRAYQQSVLLPRFERLLEIVFAAKQGPFAGVAPEAWRVEFAPLWQATSQEVVSEREASTRTYLSILPIVQAVTSGQMPRDAAMALLAAALQRTEADVAGLLPPEDFKTPGQIQQEQQAGGDRNLAAALLARRAEKLAPKKETEPEEPGETEPEEPGETEPEEPEETESERQDAYDPDQPRDEDGKWSGGGGGGGGREARQVGAPRTTQPHDVRPEGDTERVEGKRQTFGQRSRDNVPNVPNVQEDEEHVFQGGNAEEDAKTQDYLSREWKRDGFVYRGMTSEEYEATLGAGLPIQSTGAFSHESEGTSFAIEGADSVSYASYGRDDPRKTGRPVYVVEVKRQPTMRVGRDGYIKMPDPVQVDQVFRVLRLTADGDRVVGTVIKRR